VGFSDVLTRREIQSHLAMLEDPDVRWDPKLRRRIIRELQGARDPSAAEALRRAARNDPDSSVRLAALFGLQQIGDRQSVSFFTEMLEGEGDTNRRLHAIRGLANSRANEAVAPLLAALKDRDRSIRAAAADALAEIGDPAALPAIRDAARGTRRPLLRARLRAALGRLEERYPGQ
jgi:HEAT repeat protein